MPGKYATWAYAGSHNNGLKVKKSHVTFGFGGAAQWDSNPAPKKVFKQAILHRHEHDGLRAPIKPTKFRGAYDKQPLEYDHARSSANDEHAEAKRAYRKKMREHDMAMEQVQDHHVEGKQHDPPGVSNIGGWQALLQHAEAGHLGSHSPTLPTPGGQQAAAGWLCNAPFGGKHR